MNLGAFPMFWFYVHNLLSIDFGPWSNESLIVVTQFGCDTGSGFHPDCAEMAHNKPFKDEMEGPERGERESG